MMKSIIFMIINLVHTFMMKNKEEPVEFCMQQLSYLFLSQLIFGLLAILKNLQAFIHLTLKNQLSIQNFTKTKNKN